MQLKTRPQDIDLSVREVIGVESDQNAASEPPTSDPAPRRKRNIKKAVLRTLAVLGVVLLILAAVAFVLFRRDLSDARTRIASIPSNVYHSQYGDIEYLLQGKGPTVLFSHGITGGIDQGLAMTHQWDQLGGPNRFLYVSRFGYLKSSVPENATARLQAAAYKDLLDHLGIDRVVIAGNSAGGPSAMWFAIDYPERTNGLILLSSAVPGPEPDYMPKLVATNDFIYWAAVKAKPDMLLGLLLPDSIVATMTDEEMDFVVENAFEAALPISQRADGILFDNEVSLPSMNDIPFERIHVPTVIFQAVDDPREGPGGRELAERISGSEYVGLTGGHLLLRHEEQIKAATIEFIAEHSGARR